MISLKCLKRILLEIGGGRQLTEILKKIEKIIYGIKRVSNNRRVIVAFSGGLDSTVALNLAKLAIGRNRVIAANVDFGPYTYKKARENVVNLSKSLGVKLLQIPGASQQLSLIKHGPDCNLCTKRIKLGLIKFHSKGKIIITGSNQSDSWGSYGHKLCDGYYSPLFEYTKEDINAIAEYLNINIKRIGENVFREGCKLKHLLKPNVNSDYHGKAVCEANEFLLEKLKKAGIDAKIANVKIIGPLSKNIALLNIYPLPDASDHLDQLNKICTDIKKITTIEESIIVNQPMELVIRANKGQFNNLRSRYWLEKGRLQPEFAFPVKIKWLLTTNRNLKTFQVISYNYISKNEL